MTRLLVIPFCLVVASFSLLACQPAPTTNAPAANTTASNTAAPASSPAASTASTDLDQLAQRIVAQSAGVKEGEIVLVSGGVRDFELLENVVIQAEKVGAHALLSLNSDRMAKRSFAEVPEQYDAREPKLGMALARTANVTISVDSGEAEGLLADVPRARMAARAKAGEPVGAEFRRNRVRGVEVGNGLYPTEWRARRFGISREELARQFWSAVNVDYTSLQERARQVEAAVKGNELRITHPNGTDLKVSIQNRPTIVSDGIISPEDVQKGALNVYLPAGEVAVAPVAGSAQGKFVVDRTFFDGKEVTNLTLTFENGKLTGMTGEGPGFEALKADYDARGAGKEEFGFVDLGINPNFNLPTTSKLGNWIQAGMVTIGTGNNTWAGGTNNVSAGIVGHLPGCTVTVDGKAVVENGTLKV